MGGDSCEQAIAGLRFLVLGHLGVEMDGARLDVGGRLKRSLLADLLLHPNEVLVPDRLVEDLWPEEPPRDPLNTLQVAVGQLRRVLEPRRRAREKATVLVWEPPGYRLAVDTSSLDALEFEDLLLRARALVGRGDHRSGRELVARALSLWRGPPLPEFAAEPFARARIARLEEMRAAAIEERVEADLVLGRHREVAPELGELTQAYPFRERLWELRMLALHRSGLTADALRAYQEARRVFGDELGLQPGTRLVELDRRIAAQDRSLVWAAPAPPVAPAQAAVPLGDPLVGRGDEMAVMQSALDRALSGERSVLIVAGEAGAGKSRLAAELAERAWARGCLVISAVCAEAGAPPFAPVLECLSQIVQALDPDTFEVRIRAAAAVVGRVAPELLDPLGTVAEPRPLPPEQERARFFDAVARLVVTAATASPTVMVVDDLQWADLSTLAVLSYVIRRSRGARLLVVGCQRTGELPSSPEAALLLDALRREPDATYVEARVLSNDDATLLVRSVGGSDVDDDTVDEIVALAGGNPFFLRELAIESAAAGLQPSVPAAARDLVARRLNRLSPASRRLASAAAACDSPFSLGVAASAAGLDESLALDAFDELLLAGFISTSGENTCRFTHDLVRQAVYEAVSPPRRARLHRAVAEAMEQWEEQRAGRTAPGIARHYLESRDMPGAERGVAHAERAAAAAEAAHAYAEAAELLRIALALVPSDDGRLPDLTARLGRALIAAGWAEEGLQAIEDAASLVAASTGKEVAIALLARAAAFALGVGAFDAGYRLAGAGLVLEPRRGSREWAALALTNVLAGGLADPEWPGIVLGSPEQLAVAEAVRAATSTDDALPRSLLLAYRSRSDVLATAGDDGPALAFWAGEYERAVELLPSAAARAEADGRLEHAMVLRCSEARCLNALGRFDAAEDAFRRSEELVQRLVSPSLFAAHLLSAEEERWAALGEGWGQPRVDLTEVLDPRWERWYAVVRQASTARVLARLGRSEAALARLERILGPVELAPGWAENYVRIVDAAAEVLWLAGRAEHVEVLERNVREKVLEADFRYPMTDARLALGRLAAVEDRFDEAIEWFQKARVVLREQHAQPLLVVVDHDAAVVELRSGHAAEAHRLAAAAAETATALGMPGWLAAADRVAATAARL